MQKSDHTNTGLAAMFRALQGRGTITVDPGSKTPFPAANPLLRGHHSLPCPSAPRTHILAPAPHTGTCLPALPAPCTAQSPSSDQNLKDLLHAGINPLSPCQQHCSSFLKAPPLPALRLLPDSDGKEGVPEPCPVLPLGTALRVWLGKADGTEQDEISRVLPVPGDLGTLKALSHTALSTQREYDGTSGDLGGVRTPGCHYPANCFVAASQQLTLQKKAHSSWKQACPTQRPQHGLGIPAAESH